MHIGVQAVPLRGGEFFHSNGTKGDALQSPQIAGGVGGHFFRHGLAAFLITHLVHGSSQGRIALGRAAGLGVLFLEYKCESPRLILHAEGCVPAIDGERIDFLVQLVPLGRGHFFHRVGTILQRCGQSGVARLICGKGCHHAACAGSPFVDIVSGSCQAVRRVPLGDGYVSGGLGQGHLVVFGLQRLNLD